MQTRTLGNSDLRVSAIGLGPFSPLGKDFLTGKTDERTPFDKSDLRNSVPQGAARRNSRACGSTSARRPST